MLNNLLLAIALVACSGGAPRVASHRVAPHVDEPAEQVPLSNTEDGSGSEDDTPSGGFGYGTGGYGPGGIRTGWNSTKIHLGKPSVSPGLDPASIRNTLKAQAIDFKLCYEHELDAKSLDFHGTTTATFTIAVDGGTSDVSAAGFDAKVDNCVAIKIKNIKFPKPSGTALVHVTLPFTFTPPTK